MVRGDDRDAAAAPRIRVLAPPQARERGVGVEDGLDRDPPHREDDARFDQLDLPLQERAAPFGLRGVGGRGSRVGGT